MIASPLHIVETIRVTLAERVLPQLQASSWLAGDVRASLTLLTYLEDALTNGKAMAGQANAATARFLRAALDMTTLPFLTEALRAAATRAIDAAETVEPGDLMALDAAGVGLRDVMSALVAASRAEGERDPAFTAALRACLTEVAACDQALAERAGNMSPF